MNKSSVEIIGTSDLITEFLSFSKDFGQYQATPTLRMSSYFEGIIHLLTFGGGIAGLAKCLLEYVKIKNQNRKIRIKKKDGSEIEIVGNSIKEIQELILEAELMVLEEVIENGKQESKVIED